MYHLPILKIIIIIIITGNKEMRKCYTGTNSHTCVDVWVNCIPYIIKPKYRNVLEIKINPWQQMQNQSQNQNRWKKSNDACIKTEI